MRCLPRSGIKKAMVEHLSSAKGRFCWDNTSDADHAAGLLKITVNDTTETSFGAMKVKLQYDGKIGLTNARGVSQVIVKSNLSRRFDTSYKNKITEQVEGILHKLSEEMRLYLVKMYILDSPEMSTAD